MSNGADVWSRLGDQKLRQSLDKESFQIIQPLLPVIDQVPLPLREDMQRLGLIYSFLNAEQLFKPSFRKEIFNCLYENELQDLAGLLSIDEWQRDEIIKVMVKIPFGPNPKARVISQFLGVPDWLLDLHDEAVSDPPTQSIPWPVKYQALSKQNSDAAMEYNYAGRRPFKRLKSYQNRVYSEALEFLNKNNSRLILNMPDWDWKNKNLHGIGVCFFERKPD